METISEDNTVVYGHNMADLSIANLGALGTLYTAAIAKYTA